VTLCGEMAGKPISAMALIGIGYRSVSMSPAAIGPVKAMLLGLDAGALSRMMNEALDDKTSTIPMRETLKRFAQSHNIPL
jgi:phosphotransferase system enzyme I (PtsP)